MLRLCSFLSTTAMHSRHFPFIDGALQLHKLRLAHQQMTEDLRELQQQYPLDEMHPHSSSNKAQKNPTVLQQSLSSSSRSTTLQEGKKKPHKRVLAPDKKSQRPNGRDPEEVVEAIEGKKNACLVLENEFFREVEAFRPVFTMSASLEVSKEYSQCIYRALCYFGLQDDPLMRQMAGVVSRSMLRRRAGDALEESFATVMPPAVASPFLDTSHSPTRSTSAIRSSGSSHGVSAPFPRENSARRAPSSTLQRRNGREEEGAVSLTSSSSSFSSTLSPPPMPASSLPSFFSTFRDGEERVVTTLPTELPNPPQVFATATLEYAQRRRPGGLRIPAAHRGHWVLQEPEIAITREERKEDPW